MRFTCLSISYIVLFNIAYNVGVFAKDILELQGVNFELSLTSYQYLAILFYDDNDLEKDLENTWSSAADLIKTLPHECEMAKISGNDPELKELITAYSIPVPSIRIFRRGIMSDYRGPLDSIENIARYIQEDAMPSVSKVNTIHELKATFQSNLNTVVFGMFREEDVNEDFTDVEGYSISAWGQFQAAADSLRGHAKFYVVTSHDIINDFKLNSNDLPTIYMVSNEGEGIIKYSGEILELNLSEWVLRNSSPAMGELTLASSSGELYATQFFSSRKLKFILFINPNLLTPSILDTWNEIALTFTGKAIFSYMTQPVSDVLDYFEIDMDKDCPMIAAHQPINDYKYKSNKNINLKNSHTSLLDFVTGVVSGVIQKVIKSDPIPSTSSSSSITTTSTIVTAVGINVIDLVSSLDKDVLLVAYTPWCSNCKKLLPTYDILGKAVQGESRIVIAKINVNTNDIPVSWGVKSYPSLLWFPAKDKPYKTGIPVPRSYWDAGYSLHELVGFVQREGSFDLKSLKVATSEQLGTLIGDEDIARAKYEVEERYQKRNEGREVHENLMLDQLVGEIVYDGKRWHILIAGIISLICILQFIYIIYIHFIQLDKTKLLKKKKT